MRDCVVLGGSSHEDLVRRVCAHLDVPPAGISTGAFANGETSIEIYDTVREKNVFVVQSGCGEVNDNLMELLVIISACKAASAKTVTAVLPLFPYCRQLSARDARLRATRHAGSSGSSANTLTGSLGCSGSSHNLAINGGGNGGHMPGLSPRKVATLFGADASREATPVPELGPKGATLAASMSYTGGPTVAAAAGTAVAEDNSGYRNWIAQAGSLVATLLTTAGTDHVITMDLHDPHFQGFFDIPVDNLYFRPLLLHFAKQMIPNHSEAVVVSPDAGGAKRATAVADQLQTRFALIHKDKRNSATLLVGDVSDRVVIIIDDLIDSGKTMMRAARVVKEHGAKEVWAICTHGLLSADAAARIKRSSIDYLVTTNSVPQDEHRLVLGDRLLVVDIAQMFAEAIRRINNGESISMLFEHDLGLL